MIRLATFLLICMVVLAPEELLAQCAMCKAVVESNAQSGDNVVTGVNNAILYLMGIPYALLGIIGYLWYKKFLKSA